MGEEVLEDFEYDDHHMRNGTKSCSSVLPTSVDMVKRKELIAKHCSDLALVDLNPLYDMSVVSRYQVDVNINSGANISFDELKRRIFTRG